MKRILSIILCFVMICSTMSVFAATQVTLNIVTVGYPAPNATESNEISVSGTNANANSSLVLRVFDGSGKLLYITKYLLVFKLILKQYVSSILTVYKDTGFPIHISKVFFMSS